MATYEITEYDKDLTRQQVLELRGKFDIYDLDNKYLDSIEGGLVSGTISINAESDIRRTLSITLLPRVQDDAKIREDGLIWLDKKIKFYIGIADMRTHEYTWYSQGTFVFMSGSSTYDAVTNQLQLECSDMMSFLDGTRNGTLGQLTISYPAYEDFFQTTWIDDAKANNAKTKDEVFKWVIEQGDSYNNDLTTCEDKRVTDAVWNLMTNQKLEQNAISENMKIINEYLSSLSDDMGKKHNIAVFDNYHAVINEQSIFVNTIREYYPIRDQMITALSQLGRFGNLEIDNIGEAKGMPGYSEKWDYMKYREDNPIWDAMPFDQEFSSGSTVLNIITTFRDLYENYETFFDINETFCCKQIPSGDDDIATFDNTYLEDILISENLSLDFTEPKNIYEVWGQVIEPDFFANETVTFNNNVYSAKISSYSDGYANGDIIAINIPETNDIPTSLDNHIYLDITGTWKDKTNAAKEVNFGKIKVYDENYEIPLDTHFSNANTNIITKKPSLNAGATCVFKIQVKNGSPTKAYYLGEWQPHAIEVLTTGELGDDYITVTNGEQVKKYSQEYYKEIYNCNTVNMLIDKDNPFTVQKIGEVNAVKNDDNIQSVSIALETAHQELYRVARLTDNITLTTKICPFSDVNQKVIYKPSDSDEPYEYIVKSLSHDIQGGTTSWTLMRYKRLYLLSDELLDGIPEEDKIYWRK